MFFPVRGSLGYSDALFLYGVPFSAARLLGIDIFSSFELIILSLPLVGYIGALWLFRGALQLGRLPAVIGSLLFAFSSALAASSAHGQLYAVALVPYVVVSLVAYLRRISTGKALIPGISLAMLYPLLAYTSFYIAWFLLLFLAIITAIAIVSQVACNGWGPIRHWLRCVLRHWHSVATPAVIAGLSSIPFVMTYLPVLRLFPRRPFSEVIPLLPTPIDLFNVGFDNILWGWALRRLVPGLQARPAFWELNKGLSPVVLLGFILALLFIVWTRNAQDDDQEPGHAYRMRSLVFLCAGGVCLMWFLLLRWDDHSLWWVVYRLWPGGGAIRAAYRFNILLMLPVAFVIAYCLDRTICHFRRIRCRRGIAFIVLISLFMVAEQASGFHRDILSKQSQRAMLSGVAKPPAFCRSMAMLMKTDPYSGWWAPPQIDAMLISQRFGIPTVNGYSGWTPEGWDLHLPAAPGYTQRVITWAKEHQIANGLCFYVPETNTWSLFRDAKTDAQSAELPLSSSGEVNP
jgi:MFS family permease